MNMKTTLQIKSVQKTNDAKSCDTTCNDLKPTNKIIVTSENFLTLAWEKKTLGF